MKKSFTYIYIIAVWIISLQIARADSHSVFGVVRISGNVKCSQNKNLVSVVISDNAPAFEVKIGLANGFKWIDNIKLKYDRPDHKIVYSWFVEDSILTIDFAQTSAAINMVLELETNSKVTAASITPAM